MDYPILILPHESGFRASTGAPLDLVADGPTRDDAVVALRKLVAAKLAGGGEIRVMTVTDVDMIQAKAHKLGESPVFEEWVAAVQEYRRVHNTVPDTD